MNKNNKPILSCTIGIASDVFHAGYQLLLHMYLHTDHPVQFFVTYIKS